MSNSLPTYGIVVVVVDATSKGIGKYLQQSGSCSVRKHGYSFTSNVYAAWLFPSVAQALAKAKIVCRHMDWSINAMTIKLLEFDDDTG